MNKLSNGIIIVGYAKLMKRNFEHWRRM